MQRRIGITIARIARVFCQFSRFFHYFFCIEDRLAYFRIFHIHVYVCVRVYLSVCVCVCDVQYVWMCSGARAGFSAHIVAIHTKKNSGYCKLECVCVCVSMGNAITYHTFTQLSVGLLRNDSAIENKAHSYRSNCITD